MGHGGILSSGAQGQNGVGAGIDLPLQQLGEHLEIDAAILLERRDHSDDGPSDVFKFHMCVLHFL